MPVTVNPGSVFSCYWKLPLCKHGNITLENLNSDDQMGLYYQINYTLTPEGGTRLISTPNSAGRTPRRVPCI